MVNVFGCEDGTKVFPALISFIWSLAFSCSACASLMAFSWAGLRASSKHSMRSSISSCVADDGLPRPDFFGVSFFNCCCFPFVRPIVSVFKGFFSSPLKKLSASGSYLTILNLTAAWFSFLYVMWRLQMTYDITKSWSLCCS